MSDMREGCVVFQPHGWMYRIERITQGDDAFDAHLHQFLAMILQLERGDVIVSEDIDPWTVMFRVEDENIRIEIRVGTEVLPEQIALWVFNARLIVEMEIQRQALLRMQQGMIEESHRQGQGGVLDPTQLGVGGLPGRIIQPTGVPVDPRLVEEASEQVRQMQREVRRYS